MIAVDTSSFARYLSGIEERDTQIVRGAVRAKSAVLPPVVLTELLTNRELPAALRDVLAAVRLLDITDGYWLRAGLLRGAQKQKHQKGALGDCLIAQSCIDHDVPLITYDRDFRQFIDHGLKLL